MVLGSGHDDPVGKRTAVDLARLRDPENVDLVDRMGLKGTGLLGLVTDDGGCLVVERPALVPSWLAAPPGRLLRQRCGHPLCLRPSHQGWAVVSDAVLLREWQWWHRNDDRSEQRAPRRVAAPASPRTPLCSKGHPLDRGNAYVVPGKGTRRCRTCQRERARERRARNPKPPRPTITHCPHGHEYTPENSFQDSKGRRRCRTCRRERNRLYEQRKQQEQDAA